LRSLHARAVVAHAPRRTPAEPKRNKGWSRWYWPFFVQFALCLWPPFYNRIEPIWIAQPFFDWYQLLVVLIGAVLTAIVHFVTRD
jgi:hypothetical protein